MKPSAVVALASVALAGPALVAPALAAQAVPEGSTYVAMGSSFASGPGVTEEAADGLARCSQSRDNYARQVARALKLRLVDRSCGGATTVHILEGGQFGLPAQLDGLTSDTRLVTVTIGGNDIRYMADLGVVSCRNRPDPGGACPAAPDFDMEAAFARLGVNMRKVAAEVRRRSPQARLVFVDYVTVLPDSAPCPAVPLTAADLKTFHANVARLAQLTAQVATEAGADLVRASELTHGHDACAADAWVNGYVARGPGWGPVSYHPKAAAMTAVAKALEARLGR